MNPFEISSQASMKRQSAKLVLKSGLDLPDTTPKLEKGENFWKILSFFYCVTILFYNNWLLWLNYVQFIALHKRKKPTVVSGNTGH